ncbi:MAG: hypothetical protein QXL01_01330 [Thermoplasmatales archaeon]
MDNFNPMFGIPWDQDEEDDGISSIKVNLDTYNLSINQRKELEENWKLLSDYIEQFGGQKIVTGEHLCDLLKKINHTIQVLINEIMIIEEENTKLRNPGKKKHPLYDT